MREILTYGSVRGGAGHMACIPLLDPQSKAARGLAAIQNISKRRETRRTPKSTGLAAFRIKEVWLPSFFPLTDET